MTFPYLEFRRQPWEHPFSGKDLDTLAGPDKNRTLVPILPTFRCHSPLPTHPRTTSKQLHLQAYVEHWISEGKHISFPKARISNEKQRDKIHFSPFAFQPQAPRFGIFRSLIRRNSYRCGILHVSLERMAKNCTAERWSYSADGDFSMTRDLSVAH